MKLRILGDSHGNYKRYLAAIKDVDYSVHLGDLGLSYEFLKDVDPERHRIIPGNHDNYQTLIRYPHFLQSYGYIFLGPFEFFYLRGGLSIDKQWRTQNIDWWEQEELSFSELYEAFKSYIINKPRILLSHELSTEAIDTLDLKGLRLNPPFKIMSTTQQALQKMVDFYRPHLAVGGHWHLTAREKINNCLFQCVGTDDFIDLDSDEPNKVFNSFGKPKLMGTYE